MSNASNTKKRKSDGKAPAKSKKARTATFDATAERVKTILDAPEDFDIPADEEETRELVVDLAKYIQALQTDIESLKPKTKSREEINAAAAKLQAAACSGIRKQMTWKPSCKTGGARWLYDGVCQDPEVFGAMLGLDGPPTFKSKKWTNDAFQAVFGNIEGSARYNTLRFTSDVNIAWKPAEGTFKFSGSYGV
ncbi:hypothetical protein BDN72DRAFT_142928 [Pluteus cervinus]|uniref:Uncharacterized protein n=1 Tax=Pluteus cervinus TaxID=181527 RepID=A0ACD3ALG9_9AGAR|nr:hypothetical protein BDN72DRAFT_142928 [Pluteus cervinus]